MKKLLIILALLTPGFTYAQIQVVTGGTGLKYAQSSFILFGAGANPFATTTIFSFATSTNTLNFGTLAIPGAFSIQGLVNIVDNSGVASPFQVTSGTRYASLADNGSSQAAGQFQDNAFTVSLANGTRPITVVGNVASLLPYASSTAITTSGNMYVNGNLGISSSTPSEKLSVVGNGMFSGKVITVGASNISCNGGCTGGAFHGAAVEGVAPNGGLGGHFKSTEVSPTPSMECDIASGDVSPDGYGIKCVNGSITALLIDTYTTGVNGRPANLGYLTGPGMFGIGTTSPYARLSIVTDGNGTTSLVITPPTVPSQDIVRINQPGGLVPSFEIASSSRLDVTSPAGNTTAMNLYGNANNFYQINMQNKNSGANASSDFVATANNGDDNTNFVDFGINGSGGGTTPFTTANDGYLYSATTTLNIGALGSQSFLNFYTTGGVTSPVQRMTIDTMGEVGIGTSSPYAELSVGSTTVSTTTLALIPGNITISHLVDFYANGTNGPHSVITGAGSWGIATSSPGSTFSIGTIANFTNGTSTMYTGLNLTAGCFSITNTCVNGVTNGFAGMITGWTTGTSLNATSTPTARAYFATSTTATSTFMGKLAVGTTTLSMPADSVLFVGGKVAIDKGTSNATSTINLGNVGRSNPGCINWVWQNGASYSTSSVFINTAGALVTEPNACR